MTPERIILLIFAIYHVWSEIIHARERRDLYNRLMAKDLPEFTAFEQPKEPPKGRNFMRKGLEQAYQAQAQAMARGEDRE